MTLLEEQLLSAIKEVGNKGISASELGEKLGVSSRKVWSLFQTLQTNKLAYCKKVGSVFKMFVTENKNTEEKEYSMEQKNTEDVFNLGDAIANLSVKAVVEKAYPEMRKRCIEEFGMTPIIQKFQVGNQEPVEVKCEMPPCFNEVLDYAAKREPVMLTGPAGTGKGFIARQVALVNHALFFEVNAVKNEYGLTGFVDANSRYVKTPFYDACKAVSEGKKAVFLFDEMDCSDPEALKVFNEALSSFEFTFPNDEHLTFDDLIIISACNTFGTGSDEMYCGQQLDGSTLDRFSMVMVDYNRKIEMSIAYGDEELVDFIDMFRSQTEKNGILFIASYRSLRRIVKMKGSTIPPKTVMKQCFIKSMAEDDLKNVLNNLESTLKDNFYFKACKGENLKWKVVETNGQQELELTA